MQRERIWQAGVAVALLALVASSFWQRWQVLTASPFPLGVDGYFYAIQVRGLLEHGSLPYAASPLTFWWMAPFAAATDPITGAKLGAALGGSLIALPAYGVAARMGRGRGPGLVAAALATSSACSAYLTTEFVKQGIGITVGMAALWLVLRALESASRPRIAAAVGGLVAALLAHKLAAAAVAAIAVPAIVEEARGKAVLRGRRLLYLTAAVIAVALVTLVLGLVAPKRFLSPHDAALLAGLVSADAHWSAPALATASVTLTLDHEALFAAVIAIAAAVAMRRWRPAPLRAGERAAMWIVVGFGIAVGLPWLAVSDPQGLGFRLRIAAFVPLALGASIVLAAALAKLAPHRRDAALAALALIFAIRPHREPIEGMVLAHPAMVSAVMAATRQIPPGATVIVPERHILFMVAWYTRAEASLRPDAVPYEHRVRLLPLSFIGMGSPLEDAIDRARREPSLSWPLGLHPRHRNGLVLVPEPTWDWVVAQLPAGVREHWAKWPTI